MLCSTRSKSSYASAALLPMCRESEHLQKIRNECGEQQLHSNCRALLYPAKIHPPCLPSHLTKSVSSLTMCWQVPSFSIIRLSILISRAAAKLVSDLDPRLQAAIDHLSLVRALWQKRTESRQWLWAACQQWQRNDFIFMPWNWHLYWKWQKANTSCMFTPRLPLVIVVVLNVF